MTENDAFLRAIIENPEDDAPRLMYADWLEERGDPRAEFIRVQYALEELPEEDEGRQALKDREEELLVAHGDAWAGRVRELTTSWTFRRGFVEEVHVEARSFLARGNELFWLAPIRSVLLDIENASIADLVQCPHVRQVRELALWPDRVEVADLDRLLSSPHLDNLRELRVDARVESPIEARLLCSIPLNRWSALHLGLALHGTSTVAQLERLALPHSLRLLAVRGVRLGNEGLRTLVELPLAAKIAGLDLRRNDITAEGARSLAAAGQMTQLVYLDLSANHIGLAGVMALAGAPQHASLQDLKLQDTALGEEGTHMLTTSPYLKRLTALDLSRDLLGWVSADILAHSPSLESLRKLALSSNGLGDKGAEAVARSPHFTRLTELSLDNNHIGPRGVCALAASPYLSRLRQLGLRNNPICYEGAEALLASPHLTGLQSLDHAIGLHPKLAARTRARFPKSYLSHRERGL